MKKSDDLRVSTYLEHITEAIERIDCYTSDMNELQFLSDTKTQDAVVRNFEIIGEACNNIMKKHKDFAEKYDQIPWEIAYEMRNALSHGYHKIDFEIVWNTIHKDLYPLFNEIKQILKAM